MATLRKPSPCRDAPSFRLQFLGNLSSTFLEHLQVLIDEPLDFCVDRACTLLELLVFIAFGFVFLGEVCYLGLHELGRALQVLDHSVQVTRRLKASLLGLHPCVQALRPSNIHFMY